MPWFLDIKDKVEVYAKSDKSIEEKLYCPAHGWPHQLPFSEPITDEPCHYHKSLWRMSHHLPFCYLIGCKNYERMREKFIEDRKTKKKS